MGNKIHLFTFLERTSKTSSSGRIKISKPGVSGKIGGNILVKFNYIYMSFAKLK